jgi:hypothetical protein
MGTSAALPKKILGHERRLVDMLSSLPSHGLEAKQMPGRNNGPDSRIDQLARVWRAAF